MSRDRVGLAALTTIAALTLPDCGWRSAGIAVEIELAAEGGEGVVGGRMRIESIELVRCPGASAWSLRSIAYAHGGDAGGPYLVELGEPVVLDAIETRPGRLCDVRLTFAADADAPSLEVEVGEATLRSEATRVVQLRLPEPIVLDAAERTGAVRVVADLGALALLAPDAEDGAVLGALAAGLRIEP